MESLELSNQSKNKQEIKTMVHAILKQNELEV